MPKKTAVQPIHHRKNPINQWHFSRTAFVGVYMAINAMASGFFLQKSVFFRKNPGPANGLEPTGGPIGFNDRSGVWPPLLTPLFESSDLALPGLAPSQSFHRPAHHSVRLTNKSWLESSRAKTGRSLTTRFKASPKNTIPKNL